LSGDFSDIDMVLAKDYLVAGSILIW